MCGIKLKRYARSFCLLLVLFFLSSFASLNAMETQDIVSNLKVSSQLLTILNSQLQSLETDLNNKNQSLLDLQTANQDLNLQLIDLTDSNNQLMGLSEQLGQQLNESQTQLTQLSEELRKQELSNFWWMFGGILGGIVLGAVGTWALITFV